MPARSSDAGDAVCVCATGPCYVMWIGSPVSCERAEREGVRQLAVPRRVCLNLSQGHYTRYWRPRTVLYRHQ